MTRLISILIFALFLWTVPTNGQTDSLCCAIKVLRNGDQFKRKDDVVTFSKKGFYLFKNFFYNLEFSDSVKVFGRIIDIKNDSIFISTSFNSATAKQKNINYDTLAYSIRQIRALQLTTDEIYGNTRNINLDDYSRELVNASYCNATSTVTIKDDSQAYSVTDTLAHSKNKKITLIAYSQKRPEITTVCYPYMTNDGIAFIYEKDGLLYIVGSHEHGK